MRNKKHQVERLPDLVSREGQHEIIADNIRALHPIYFAAMFDEMKAFQVLDRLVELFQSGILPVGSGRTGNDLFKYWKDAPLRISENERRDLYARVLGFPGGDAGTKPNREFNDLWIRFISSVAAFASQNTVGTVIKIPTPEAPSQQLVRKEGRELAANLSLHGYGWTTVAGELQSRSMRSLSCSQRRDQGAYGARYVAVIDRVADPSWAGREH